MNKYNEELLEGKKTSLTEEEYALVQEEYEFLDCYVDVEAEFTEGEYQFITYGTTTNTNDILPISESQVLGKYVYSFPKVGKIFIFMKTIPGYIFLILFPFLILIGYLGYSWIKTYKQYKKKLNNMKE